MRYVDDRNTVLDYQPIKARRWVIDLMQECFAFDKDDRPNFRKIFSTIQDESEYKLETDDDDGDSSDSSYY